MTVTSELSVTVYLDDTKTNKVLLELGDIVYVPTLIKNEAVLAPRKIVKFRAIDDEKIYMKVKTCRNHGDEITASLNVNDLGTSYFVTTPEIVDPYKFYVRKVNTTENKE